MKKITTVLLALVAMLFLSCGSQQSEEDIVVESQKEYQKAFYAQMDFEASGYTPAYTYYLSGSLNESGEITAVRYDMVSHYGVSKRSSDYLMNNAVFLIGGEKGSQTIDLFIGGSSTSIPQIYNRIAGSISAAGNESFMDIPLLGAYPGAVVEHSEEIYGVLSSGLGININESTTLAEVLTAARLYDGEKGSVKNGRTSIPLKGAWGGGNYDQQLTALEKHIVEKALTLPEMVELLKNNNQGDDNRDAVSGATVMFDPKMQAIAAMVAGIDLNPHAATVLGSEVKGDETIYSVEATGKYLIAASIAVDKEGKMTAFNVTEHKETEGMGKDLIESDFIVKLISSQNALDSVDAVAGATMTANALKNMASAALAEANK